jgi:predicted dehydrogenase
MTEKSVGIVGAGVIASSMHLPVLRAMPGVKIDWIMDANEARASHLARLHRTQHAHPDMLSELPPTDFALLAIPLPPRAPYLAQFAKSITAVFVEKPLANTLAEHDALMATFPGWQLAVGYQRRYYAQFRLIDKIISTGSFGALKSVSISEGGRITRTGGGGDYQTLPWSAGGGIVKNLGCHALDLAFWLTGARDFRLLDKELQVDGGADFDCRATAILTASSGQEIRLDFGVSWLDRMENSMTFAFETMSLVCGFSPADHVLLHAPDGNLIGRLDATKMGATTSAQAFFLEWQDVMTTATARTHQPLSAASTRPVAHFMAALLDEEHPAR